MTGRIVLAATPIGNVDDASPRLREALETAEIVAAEDTRRVRDLATRLGIRIGGSVVAHHDHNEAASAAELVARARDGAMIVVVSDAGMPAVSDPGFRVVEAAVREGVEVTVLPGPSAALAALALSGLPTDRFCFEGFLPRRPGERSARLASLALEERTMLFFEAPHRLAATLAAMGETLGADRPAAVSREITKTYEETRRGTLGELAAWAGEKEPRGEIVVTVAGRAAAALTVEALVAEVLARVATGERAKSAVADVAATAGVPSRELYAAVLAARDATA
ncbi:16S rRNA (cytidine(1402)-2'-O)-methyltransferase [Demequina subtropica]|uniref:16S rRNA (cytidine(1402)-2'-O)-methyltransferase n=1 Tax=Demequina subtropica TaxID=1638989 RepID=UPI0007811B92|nr:16S rRNA (cytidine(1402)-2'-O)-methyltransferase [Demequina subtropica]